MPDKIIAIDTHTHINHGHKLDSDTDNKLFSFAAEHKAIVLIHPETDADYILPFVNKYPNVTFIMAHMGSYRDDSYANAIEFAENSNVYTDTS